MVFKNSLSASWLVRELTDRELVCRRIVRCASTVLSHCVVCEIIMQTDPWGVIIIVSITTPCPYPWESPWNSRTNGCSAKHQTGWLHSAWAAASNGRLNAVTSSVRWWNMWCLCVHRQLLFVAIRCPVCVQRTSLCYVYTVVTLLCICILLTYLLVGILLRLLLQLLTVFPLTAWYNTLY